MRGIFYKVTAIVTSVQILMVSTFMILPQVQIVQAATVGADTFTRTVSSGWGTADTGGAYTTVGTAANFSVSGGTGNITFAFAGVTREAYLASLSEDTVDIQTKVRLSTVPSGGGYVVDLVGRRIDSSNSYRGRVEIKSDGQIITRAIAQVGGAENVRATFNSTGITYTANMVLNVRARFSNTGTTTMEMKIWQDGSAEPGWQISTTDTSSALQASGAAGVRATSSSDAGTLTVSFDDLVITDGNLLNQAPTVNAGVDQSISIPNTAVMAATVTDDAFPGNPLVMTWSQTSGPVGGASISNTAIEDPTITFTQVGTYVFQLNAHDGEFSVNDTIQVVVTANTTPIVDAGTNQSINLPTSLAVLNATITDNAPSSITRLWTVDSAPNGATYSFNNATAEDPTFTFTNRTPGTYILRLTVGDGEFQVSDTVTLTLVLPPNQAPVVNVGQDRTVTLPDNVVNLTATATDDGLPLGSSLSYLWDVQSGPPGGTVLFSAATSLATTVTFSNSVAGTYVIRFTATDGTNPNSDTLTITLQSNGPPVVDAGLPQVITMPNSVFLNSTITDDGQLVPYTVLWSKVSGPGTVTFSPGGTVEDPQATFSRSGTYVLQLTANDGEFSASDTVQVTVNPDPNEATNARTAVYRFYSPVFRTHFFTINAAEKNSIIANLSGFWNFEGIGYYAFNAEITDATPVYRFWSSRLRRHFFTSSAEEKAYLENVLGLTWRYEGIAWYVYPSSYTGPSTTVYRFFSPLQNTHFFTASTAEKNSIISTYSPLIWTLEYEAWKVPL